MSEQASLNPYTLSKLSSGKGKNWSAAHKKWCGKKEDMKFNRICSDVQMLEVNNITDMGNPSRNAQLHIINQLRRLNDL